MPYGPGGEWRPADPVACAVHVAKIATGGIEETYAPPTRPRVSEAARKAGRLVPQRWIRNGGGRSPRPGPPRGGPAGIPEWRAGLALGITQG